jgi:cytolysin-activating lysine-acyltransferase
MSDKAGKTTKPGGGKSTDLDTRLASAVIAAATGHTNGAGGAGNGQAPNPSATPGSPFQFAAPDGAAKTMSAVLGEIVWLMSQSQVHKSFFISDLEWPVAQATNDNNQMTPVFLQQFRLFYDKDKPIGVVFWGTVSDEVAVRLTEGTSKLRPQGWKSGDNLWVVEVVAPFDGAEEMVKDLKATVFPDRAIRMLVVRDGKREVRL